MESCDRHPIRVVLFSVELDDQLIQSNGAGTDPAIARVLAASRQQWIDGVQSFRKWVNNRPVSAVVGGALLGEAARATNGGPVRFANEFLTAPLAAARPRAEQRFSVRLSVSADALPGVVLSHSQQTCD